MTINTKLLIMLLCLFSFSSISSCVTKTDSVDDLPNNPLIELYEEGFFGGKIQYYYMNPFNFSDNQCIYNRLALQDFYGDDKCGFGCSNSYEVKHEVLALLEPKLDISCPTSNLNNINLVILKSISTYKEINTLLASVAEKLDDILIAYKKGNSTSDRTTTEIDRFIRGEIRLIEISKCFQNLSSNNYMLRFGTSHQSISSNLDICVNFTKNSHLEILNISIPII